MSTSTSRDHAVVVGAGIVGICCALFLRRNGFDVTVVDPEAPGSQTSFGNAGGFGIAEVMPLSAPGVLWKVPGWLFDPLGPLAIRWAYLPRLAPWLVQFVRAGSKAGVERQATALAALLRPTFDDYMPLLQAAGVADSVISTGALTVYSNRAAYARDALEWNTKRACGIRCDELDAAAVHELEPDLSPDITFGVYTPDWRHTVDPYRLVSALAELFSSEGGKLRCARVLQVQTENGTARRVHLHDGAAVGLRSSGRRRRRVVQAVRAADRRHRRCAGVRARLQHDPARSGVWR